MSEEASSPSSSESSPSSKSFQMKRQSTEESTLEETVEKTDCKRRRKNGQNNNGESNEPEAENENNETNNDENLADCDNQASLLPINAVNSDEAVTLSAISASVTESEPNVENTATTSQPTYVAVAHKGTDNIATDNSVNVDSNSSVGEVNASANQEGAPRNHGRRHRHYRRSGRLSSTSSSSNPSDILRLPSINSDRTMRVGRNLVDSDDDSDDDEFGFPYLEDSSDSDDDNDMIDDSIMPSDDDDEDSNFNMFDTMLQRDLGGYTDSEQLQTLVEEVLAKPLPKSKWNTMAEVIYREHGFSNRFATNPWCKNRFNQRFYASTYVVEHIEQSHILSKHKGCVNSLNFNRSGDLLCSGSDDRRIVVWDWAHKKVKHVYSSGHRENIFQTKFITSGNGIDIVSAGRDGQVRRSIIPSHGKALTTCLYYHRSAVHKLVICPDSPFEIMSVGEDGFIIHSDLRNEANSDTLTKVEGKDSRSKVGLFSIAHHPYVPEIVVCGSDEFVRVYDKRNFSQPVHMMCPMQSQASNQMNFCQVTCCTYNHNGTEILATYSDEQIYLFDNKNYTEGSHLHSYRGHYNHRTIKGVNFFGPNSEYVVSGSDCGYIFFWDKETEAILNFKKGDEMGVVNCLEPHPTIPVLATSGLDYHVKIWAPGSKNTVPDKEKLKKCIHRNISRSGSKGRSHYLDRALNHIILQSFRPDTIADDSSDASNFEVELNSASSTHSDNSNQTDDPRAAMFDSDDTDDNDTHHLGGLTCRTQ